MAERKSVNKYYPPDWDPTKGSVNKYVGQHPLRDRAKKIGQGILVIRFEMPYNIWCGGCNNPIGMGVRYNAEKKKTGNYYSTPIYTFRMKCHLCDNYFEIQTDPKNHDYVILSGARRKEQRWDPKDNEQVVTEDKTIQKKMATDAMYKLEHGSDDKEKGRAGVMSLGSLTQQRGQYKDDYILNKLARQKFREEKKRINAQKSKDKQLLQKSSLDIDLVPESETDIQISGLLKYSTTESYDDKQKQKRKEIEMRPIFQSVTPESKTSSSSSVASSSSSSSSQLNIQNIRKAMVTQKSATRINPFDSSTSSKSEKPLYGHASLLGIRRKSKPTLLEDILPEDKPQDSNIPTMSERIQGCTDDRNLHTNTTGSGSEGCRVADSVDTQPNCDNHSDTLAVSSRCNDLNDQILISRTGDIGENDGAELKQEGENVTVKNVQSERDFSREKQPCRSSLGLVMSYSDSDE